MKTAKRVLAIVMAMLMAVSVFAVAASAAGSLQTAIDNAAAGDTVSISANTKESVTITKDLTLDLGGKILKSVEGSPAITVSGGAKVTITNGYVESYYKSYSGATKKTLETLKELTSNKNPAAILATGSGTTVTITDVRAMGGLLRIPKTREYYVPTGSALKIYGGAKAVLNNAVLIGSYAVSNDPSNTGSATGTVEINDALLFGFMDYVKRQDGIVYDAETVEKVNAADRIVGYLNDNITLTSGELDILDKVMDDRVYIFTAKPTDDKAIVTIDKTSDDPADQWATITAEEVKDLATTDCSYKYIPENAYDVATGKTYALNESIPAAEVEGKEIRINYRLAFELKGDIKKYANNFDYYFHYFYDKAFAKLDSAYADVLDKYEDKIQEFADIFNDLDEAAAKPITVGGQTYTVADELGDDFYKIMRGLLSIGGVTLYNKTDAGKENGFTTKKFDQALYNYGAAAPAEGTYEIDETNPHTQTVWVRDDSGNRVQVTETYYDVTVLGTLDKFQALLDEFNAIKGSDSFKDQDNWNDFAQFVVDNYQAVIDDLKELETNLKAFETTLNSGRVGEIVEALGMKSKVKTLTDIIEAVEEVNDAVETALDHSIVQNIKAKVDAHANDGTVAQYVRKIKNAANDYTVYFTPNDFLLEDGAYGKAYRVTGPTQVKVLEKGKLNVEVIGSGTVEYVPDEGDEGETASTSFVGLNYAESITLNAVAGEGAEFLYYVNTDTGRILSTNATMVVDTQIERYVDAVFEAVGSAKVVFTNTSGVISDTKDYADSVDASDVTISIPADYVASGWGPNGNTTLTSADYTSAYAKGTSAFENGAIYNNKGYAFKLNSTTANKYLAMPKFDAAADAKYNIYFVDGETTWGRDDVKSGTGITYTATGDNFSYWKDQATGKVLSVYKSYTITALSNLTVEAVYGAAVPAEPVLNIVKGGAEDIRIRVYGERSVPASMKVLTTGFVISNTDSVPVPTIEDVNREDVRMTVSTLKTNQGVSTVGVTFDKMNQYDGVSYVRAFVEVETATGSQYFYSDVYQYPAD